ncbi:sensor histidine kinase [Flavobacterium sp. '19STA2R22 D10 B1']|uniref:sensor histidine kinase n=1 Tax=Flavobacterium aerium TaxID=3037261 RepID=UPI00278BD346|nr:HAMP domain-containing sensor histidine kinase [Flavobacterium sp. '19STA2R22 D10 B1']
MPNLYAKLSSYNFLSRSYSLKFLFVAFVGIHLPLIGLIALLVFNKEYFTPLYSILVALLFTLIAAFCTLFVLHKLLEPLRQAKGALNNYLTKEELPNLPTHFQDEVGLLLKDLQSTLTQLHQLSEDRQDLIYLLSHDLRSPLIQVINFCELIREETNLELIAEWSVSLEEEMETQLNFIKNMMILLRKNDGETKELVRRNVSISEMMEEVLGSLKMSIHSKKIIIHKKVESGMTVKVNPDLFKHALLNILVNAIKFSYQNGAIDISCSREKDGAIDIKIKDYGIGFDKPAQEDIFNKFTVQLQKGTLGESSNGLGLYLTKNIITKHKGTITAFSEGTNKGAVFKIVVPIIEE